MSTPGTQRRLQPSGIKLPAPPASLLNGLPKGVVMAAAGRRIGKLITYLVILIKLLFIGKINF